MANYPIHIYVDHIKRYWPISARTRTRNNWRTLRLIKCITNQLPTGQNEFCQNLITKLLLTVAQPQSRSFGSFVWQNACSSRIQSINIYHCFREDIASKRDPQSPLIFSPFRTPIDAYKQLFCFSTGIGWFVGWFGQRSSSNSWFFFTNIGISLYSETFRIETLARGNIVLAGSGFPVSNTFFYR